MPHPGKDSMKVLIGYPATFLARQDKQGSSEVFSSYMYITSHCYVPVGEIFNNLM